MRFGGFPEPCISGSETEAARWRLQHIERVVREDIQDLEPVKDVRSLLLLIDLLRERVGSPVSFASLGRDLELSPHTVARWIRILEHMYVVFPVTPWSRNVARSILKAPKIYFYDSGAVRGDDGIRLENAVAVCLQKWVHFLEDTEGRKLRLHCVRDKEKREVDFAVAEMNGLRLLIEVKHSDAAVSGALAHFAKKLRPAEAVQIVETAVHAETANGIHVRPAAEWLDSLDA